MSLTSRRGVSVSVGQAVGRVVAVVVCAARCMGKQSIGLGLLCRDCWPVALLRADKCCRVVVQVLLSQSSVNAQ